MYTACSMKLFFISVAPYNVEIIGTRRYPYGSDIELNCTSEGGPRLDFSWIFSNITIDRDDATLNIDNVTVTNGVNYTCNVNNNAGVSSNTTTVYSEFIKLLSRDQYLENYFLCYQNAHSSPLYYYCKCVVCLCQQSVHASLLTQWLVKR